MRTYADIQGSSLTDAQNAAVYTIDRSVAVIAGAGSGKTTVLIERILHLIGDDWAMLDRLLAITFTEKAAGELRTRLRAHIPSAMRPMLDGAWIGTFHSALARILRQNAPQIGLDPSFDILDENAASIMSEATARSTLLRLLSEKDEHATSLIDSVDFKVAIQAIEELMAFRWHAASALKDAREMDGQEGDIVRALSHVYAKAVDEMQLKFQRQNAVDFQELEIRALSLLQANPDVLAGYRKKFRHILVDEFQDTNDLQTEFVLKLYDPKVNKLCIVGDPRQSIYRFRGANIDCFAKVLEHIRSHGGATIELKENFRSATGIVDFVNICQDAISDGLFGSLARDGLSSTKEAMVASRKEEGKGPSVVSLRIDAGEDPSSDMRRQAEGDAIALLIEELVSGRGVRYCDIVCLFQALTGISHYERAMKVRGIPHLVFGGGGLLERQEVADLIAALSYADDPMDDMAMLGLMRSPIVGLSDDELAVMAGPDGKSLRKSALVDPRCSILQELSSMRGRFSPSEIVCRTIRHSSYDLVCEMLDPSGGMTANIDRFISIARDIESTTPTTLTGFNSFIADLRAGNARLSDAPCTGDTSNAVRCMTVHAAKGLEFPIVILPDLFRRQRSRGGNFAFTRDEGIAFKLKDPSFPMRERAETERYLHIHNSDTAANGAELKRLLYVAMTRAKDLLVLPTHEGLKPAACWQQWLAPAIEKFSKEGRLSVVDASRGRKSDSKWKTLQRKRTSPHVMIERTLQTSVTVSELECYHRCPQEYFLKYEMRLPARQLAKKDEERLPANVVGSIVHTTIEKLAKTPRPDLASAIAAACVANGVMPDTEACARISGIVAPFIQLPIARKLGEGMKEMRFDWKFGDRTITGVIDWLLPAGDALEIFDFKTDRIEPGEEAERAQSYDLQLACYGLAAEAALQRTVCSTSLIFLMTRTLHSEKMDGARREKSRKLISDIIGSIDRKDFDIKGPWPNCVRCAYKHNGLCKIAK